MNRHFDPDDPRLTAYVLGELNDDERAEIEAELATNEAARRTVDEIRAVADMLTRELQNEPYDSLTVQQRAAVLHGPARRGRACRFRRYFALVTGAAACLALFAGIAYQSLTSYRARHSAPMLLMAEREIPPVPAFQTETRAAWDAETSKERVSDEGDAAVVGVRLIGSFASDKKAEIAGAIDNRASVPAPEPLKGVVDTMASDTTTDGERMYGKKPAVQTSVPTERVELARAADPDEHAYFRVQNAPEPAPGAATGMGGMAAGRYPKDRLRALGYIGSHKKARGESGNAVAGRTPSYHLQTLVQPDGVQQELHTALALAEQEEMAGQLYEIIDDEVPPHRRRPEGRGTETYEFIVDNPFRRVADAPLSTFSIDVDTASYANIRRFLSQGQLPPKPAVRIEEMVNYFTYDYPQPEGRTPFSVNVEVAGCPWRPEHKLARVGLKGKDVPMDDRPAANLVFLLDVSGSMQDQNKLPLLKKAMTMLVNELDKTDRVAIVTYANGADLALDSTLAGKKQTILNAIDRLCAQGSTNGAAGIAMAYDVAADNFVENGINRVILATDGDFNVGITDRSDLVDLIQRRAGTGVFLTVLGFGTGNLKDANLEGLADKGNGHYAYIDSFNEARKVLMEQVGSTFFTIAKDVKIQIEFNPGRVDAYRLIGYENRLMADRDFADDRKDAGDIGAGHTVTALYELVPRGRGGVLPGVDPLKYQTLPEPPENVVKSADLMTVKLRYKLPDENTSTLVEVPVSDADAGIDESSTDLRFVAAVAGFGMLLRDSDYMGDTTFELVLDLARSGKGRDEDGYRAEFINLVKTAQAVHVK